MKTKSVVGFFSKRMKRKSFARAYEESHFIVDVGVMIARLREKAGYSQIELAEKIGTAQSVVSRIENGNQNLTLKMLAKIADVLHCELSMHLKPLKMAA
ncbi:MAG: helix-turn-helix transcriptional regulator [Deltaproteobacteria bacterium]|nr:helix-turn-helix transcriptional regulator [Deltaproteobacteria bacterium]